MDRTESTALTQSLTKEPPCHRPRRHRSRPRRLDRRPAARRRGRAGPTADPLGQRSGAPAHRPPARRRLPARRAGRGLRGSGRGPPLHPRVGVRRPRLARRAAPGRAGRPRRRRPRRVRSWSSPRASTPTARSTAPITEATPRTATTGKLGVRTELLAQREASATPTVSVAASDFYGPLVRNAHAGERLVPTVLAGRTMRVLGSLDQPHSFTYVPDLAAAMIAAAARPTCGTRSSTRPPRRRSPSGGSSSWSPAAGGVPVPRMSALPVPVLGALGLVSRADARAGRDGLHVRAALRLDSSASEERLGLGPTPLADGLARTVAWWRAQQEEAA